MDMLEKGQPMRPFDPDKEKKEKELALAEAPETPEGEEIEEVEPVVDAHLDESLRILQDFIRLQKESKGEVIVKKQ